MSARPPAFRPFRRTASRRDRSHTRPRVELLEPRDVPATVTVQANAVVADRPAPLGADFVGVNIPTYTRGVDAADGSLQATTPLVQAAGLGLFRLGADAEGEPGATAGSNYHFNQPPPAGFLSTGQMLEAAEAFGGQAILTVNVLHGTPQEAAAYLAYVNAGLNDPPVSIGTDTNGTDWMTSTYWADLRAAAPLAGDPDGLNFLRLGHPAPFGFRYFEVGSETYFTAVTPAAYLQFAQAFAAYAANIDPSASIGLNVGSPDETTGLGTWTQQVLQAAANDHFVPGFLSDHNYVYDTGSENDSLLLHSVDGPHPDLYQGTSPALAPFDGPRDWGTRGEEYEQDLQVLGPAGAGVQLLATEFNSSAASKDNGTGVSIQLTSLVNGLYMADSIGSLLNSPYSNGLVWDLRNAYELPGAGAQTNLYGYRHGGDLGILGTNEGSAYASYPAESGLYQPYPSYYGVKLASQIIQPGDTVLPAQSDDPADLSAYAVREPNGHLGLLLINKVPVDSLHPVQTLPVRIQVAGFTPSGSATQWQYGTAEDNSGSDLTRTEVSLSVAGERGGGTFTIGLPSYSMTVLDLVPGFASPLPPPPPSVISGPVNLSAVPGVVVKMGPVTPVLKNGHKVKGRFQETVLLVNNSGDLIEGPFALVLSDLRPQKKVHHRPVPLVTVLNASGVTSTVAPQSPFLLDTADAQLSPSEDATFVLDFKTLKSAKILFNPILLAGFAHP